MNTRQPIYAEDDPHIRVISGPNGTWLLQKHSGQRGDRLLDPWQTIKRAFNDIAEAVGWLPGGPKK